VQNGGNMKDKFNNMGEVYFQLDNSTDTKESLFDLFKQLGFILLKEPKFGEAGYFRTATFTNNDGLIFDIIWFKNLAHIRIGEWGKAFVECSFTKIQGSYIPNNEHITLDFVDVDKRTCTLSVKRT
jgi:hypothetical protein